MIWLPLKAIQFHQLINNQHQLLKPKPPIKFRVLAELPDNKADKLKTDCYQRRYTTNKKQSLTSEKEFAHHGWMVYILGSTSHSYFQRKLNTTEQRTEFYSIWVSEEQPSKQVFN